MKASGAARRTWLRERERFVGLERVHAGDADQRGPRLAQVMVHGPAVAEIHDGRAMAARFERRGDVLEAERLDAEERAEAEAIVARQWAAAAARAYDFVRGYHPLCGRSRSWVNRLSDSCWRSRDDARRGLRRGGRRGPRRRGPGVARHLRRQHPPAAAARLSGGSELSAVSAELRQPRSSLRAVRVERRHRRAHRSGRRVRRRAAQGAGDRVGRRAAVRSRQGLELPLRPRAVSARPGRRRRCARAVPAAGARRRDRPRARPAVGALAAGQSLRAAGSARPAGLAEGSRRERKRLRRVRSRRRKATSARTAAAGWSSSSREARRSTPISARRCSSGSARSSARRAPRPARTRILRRSPSRRPARTACRSKPSS